MGSNDSVIESDAPKGRGGAFIEVAKFLVIVSILIMVLAMIFGKVVPPGMMGVRTILLQLPFGPKSGISPIPLEPGYHWNIPYYSRVQMVPQDIQILHLHRPGKGEDGVDQAVEVQTTDGSSVIVDISVLSRFYDGPGSVTIGNITLEHGGPSQLLRSLGPSAEEWNTTIRRDAVDELKRSLATLSTSEFYDPHKRTTQLEEALINLNKKMAPRGIKIESLLLRRYTYAEERIDRAVFAKNLQDQEERLNQAASDFAKASAKLEQTAAEMDAQIATLLVQGENRGRVIRSEGDLYETQKKAEGDLLVAKAGAEVDRLRAQIFASTQGSEIFVALEMAPLLSSLRGGVVGNLDPYDLDAWMKRLGLDGAK